MVGQGTLKRQRENPKIESQHYFSRHLYTVGDLDIQFDSRLQSGDIDNLKSIKEFRKYFGKRLRNLVYLSQGPSGSYPYRYKALKTLKVTLSSMPKIPILSVKTLKITSMEPLPKPRRIKIESVSGYKFLTSLEVDFSFGRAKALQSTFFRNVERLIYLRSLSIELQECEVNENFMRILQLNSLQSFSLTARNHTIERDSDSDFEDEEELIDFYTALVKSKRLSYLKLDLSESECVKSIESITAFLKNIEKTVIRYFDVRLICRVNNFLSLKRLKANLDKVDLVNIGINYQAIDFVCNINEKSANHSMTQAQRKLYLRLDGPGNLPYRGKIDNEVKIKETESTESVMALFYDIIGLNVPLFKALKVSHIRALKIDYSKGISDTDSKLKDNLKKILQGSKVLESLCIEDMRFSDKDSPFVFKELMNCVQLESLELRLNTSKYNSNISLPGLLLSLPNLKNLNLGLSDDEPEESKHAIKTIFKLENLENLTIHEGVPFLILQDRKALEQFFQGLCNLTKLKEVHLRSKLHLVPCLSEDKNLQMAKEISAEIKQIFKKNKSLEMFTVLVFSGFKIKYMRY